MEGVPSGQIVPCNCFVRVDPLYTLTPPLASVRKAGGPQKRAPGSDGAGMRLANVSVQVARVPVHEEPPPRPAPRRAVPPCAVPPRAACRANWEMVGCRIWRQE